MKPQKLVEAEMVYRLCEAYHALPEAGGVLDQSTEFLRMHHILQLGGVIQGGASGTATDDPMGDLPMELMG